MTIDESIKTLENIVEECQRVIDTGIVFDNVTMDMLYCDDTEVIEEHLANYQRCAEEHRQLAEWLRELTGYRKVRRILSQNRIATDRYGEVVLWSDIKRVLEEVNADEDCG